MDGSLEVFRWLRTTSRNRVSTLYHHQTLIEIVTLGAIYFSLSFSPPMPRLCTGGLFRSICMPVCLPAALSIVAKRCKIGLCIKVAKECRIDFSIGTIFDSYVHTNPQTGFRIASHNLILEFRPNGDRKNKTLY